MVRWVGSALWRKQESLKGGGGPACRGCYEDLSSYPLRAPSLLDRVNSKILIRR